MTKISILYPNELGRRFDMDYYLNVHMPMSIDKLGKADGFKSVSVEQGISGGLPGSEPAYVAMCHFHFDTFDSFLAAFTPHAAILQGDIPNYTDMEPVIQVNEVKISR